MNNNSGACSLHSHHQKSIILYKRVIYTYNNIIIQHRNREGKSLSEGGGGGGGGRLLEAVNVIFKTCNLQSNDAILIINVLVLDLVIGFKAKTKETIGVGCWDKVLREIS